MSKRKARDEQPAASFDQTLKRMLATPPTPHEGKKRGNVSKRTRRGSAQSE
jgi:hypothetical protein